MILTSTHLYFIFKCQPTFEASFINYELNLCIGGKSYIDVRDIIFIHYEIFIVQCAVKA